MEYEVYFRSPFKSFLGSFLGNFYVVNLGITGM